MQIYGVLQFVGSFNIVANIISEELMNSSKIYIKSDKYYWLLLQVHIFTTGKKSSVSQKNVKQNRS